MTLDEKLEAETQAIKQYFKAVTKLRELKAMKHRSLKVDAALAEIEDQLSILEGRIAQTPRGLAHVIAITCCNSTGRLVFVNVAELASGLSIVRLI
ncbi:MAG: hypothetical protein R3D90_13335 [Paracoccaceae bacterium]